MSRVFPKTDSLGVCNSYRSNKVVDHPSPNAKFSRRSPSRVNDSQVLSNIELAPSREAARPRGRSHTPGHCDPFDGTRTASYTGGLRVTRHDVIQREREVHRQDNPRALKRAVSPNLPEHPPNALYTMGGCNTKGGRGAKTFPESTVFSPKSGAPVTPTKDYTDSSKFRHTPRVASDIHNLSPGNDTSRSPVSPNRFRHTARQPTLNGVMSPSMVRPPPAYRPRAPFFTED